MLVVAVPAVVVKVEVGALRVVVFGVVGDVMSDTGATAASVDAEDTESMVVFFRGAMVMAPGDGATAECTGAEVPTALVVEAAATVPGDAAAAACVGADIVTTPI